MIHRVEMVPCFVLSFISSLLCIVSTEREVIASNDNYENPEIHRSRNNTQQIDHGMGRNSFIVVSKETEFLLNFGVVCLLRSTEQQEFIDVTMHRYE